MPYPKVKLSDDNGNTVAVDTSGASNALKVTLVDSDDIDIGNVVLQTALGTEINTSVATSATVPNLDADMLLGTHALLSARKDASTTLGITCEDSTHNALHVAISDGEGIANVDSSNNLNVILASNSGVDIGDIDVKSIVPGTGASNLGKAEDAEHETGDVGVMALAVRKDIGGTISLSDGDYAPLQVSSAGALRVAPHAVTNAGTFAVQSTLQANSGVDIGDIDVTSIVPGTGATNLGKAEDSAHISGDVGVMALGVRKDTLLASHDGDYNPFQINGNGALWTALDTAVGNTKAFSQASSVSSSSQVGIVPLVKMNDAVSAPSGHVDNDWTYFQTNIKGALYTTGGEVEDAAVQSEPLLIGGRYDSSARSLDDGDAGAVALSEEGYVRIDWEGGTLQGKGILQALGSSYNSTDRYLQTSCAVRNDTLTALGTVDAGDWAFMQVDAQGALYTTHGVTGMAHGVNTDVDTTAEQLDGSTSGLDVACKRVDLMASHSNSGKIYIGGSDTIGGFTGGIVLKPGDFYSIDINNLNQIWIEASVVDQNLRYLYYT